MQFDQNHNKTAITDNKQGFKGLRFMLDVAIGQTAAFTVG